VTAYVVRRVLLAIPVLIAITLAGYITLSLAPGDPIRARMDPEVLARMTPEQIEAQRRAFGLDQPVIVQYGRWLADVVRGDLGYSIVTRTPVINEISARLAPTILLMGTALVIGLLVGIPFGVIAAVRQYTVLDYLLTASTMFFISTPVFVTGLIAIYLFAVSWQILPVGGMETLGEPFSLTDRLAHLIMPATILGIAIAAPLMRYTRASMLEVLNSEYLTTARSKGLRSRVVLGRHGLRNALIPVITLIGLLLPELVAGAVITEQLFAWPGMGSLAVQAASNRDPALMMGVTVVIAVGVLVSSLVADVAYGAVDPRIRYD
jgi:peptide/nickel transport system permease protein